MKSHARPNSAFFFHFDIRTAKLNAKAVVLGTNRSGGSELLEFGRYCFLVGEFDFDRH